MQKQMKKTPARRLVYAALFFALAYVLPFLTGQIPEIGAMLCPMHIPVLLCGFVCGWQWGAAVGGAVPLLRALTLGAPPLFPTALCMAFELAAYGALTGWLYRALPARRWCVYPALLLSMLGGRLVWGAARFLCTGLDVTKFGLSAFWTGAVVQSLPGIAVQLVLVPPLALLLTERLFRRPD